MPKRKPDFWKRLCGAYRKLKGIAPLTAEEAEAAYDAAEPVPMSRERIASIVEYATSDTKRGRWKPRPIEFKAGEVFVHDDVPFEILDASDPIKVVIQQILIERNGLCFATHPGAVTIHSPESLSERFAGDEVFPDMQTYVATLVFNS